MASLMSKLVDTFDGFFDFLGGKLYQSFPDYCDLETADSKNALVSKDGSLLTVIEVKGIKSLTGGGTLFNSVILPLKTSLQSLLGKKAHMIQVWFEVDPDRTREDIRRILAPARVTTRALQMDMDDVLEERERVLPDWTDSETCYMVLWTRPSAMSKADTTEEAARRKAPGFKPPLSTLEAQDPLRGFMSLRDRHASFVGTVRSEMQSAGIDTQLLDVYAALRAVRRVIDGDFTDEEWKASLPGDAIVPSMRKTVPAAESWDIVWPKLGWQVCPRDAKIIDDNVVQVGSRIYSPMYIDLFPSEPQLFSSLLARTKEKNLPWRISFLIEGGGMSDFSYKAMAAGLLGFASSGNKMAKKAFEELKDAQENEAATIVKLRVSVCTWADKGTDPVSAREQREVLSRRSAELVQSIQSWGACMVSEVTGDPVAGFSSSALAFTHGSIGTPAAAQLEEALALLPLARPSSPWSTGAVTFRSPDGKLMPYQPYSKEQTTWINLLFAKPGSGKSVLMNMFNLALCMAPGLTALPRIAIIDIGPSSSGLISLLRESLPQNQRHLVMHHRLQMVERDSINPFDTQLGCRYPTQLELSFLRNFIILLTTDMNSDKPYDGMPGLVSAVIDEVYKARSDKNDPNLYASGISDKVDGLVHKLRIHVDARTTWWEVVDELFRNGFTLEAQIAQRYAVPLLSDCAGVSNSEKIRNTYGKMETPSKEQLVSAFGRLLGEALDFFPILARPTAFDIGDARVVALDLDDVAKTGGAVASRITSVMYMLARQVMGKDFYLNKDAVPDMPAPASMPLRDTVPAQAYRDFHKKRIEEINASPKRICYDEFHHTSKSEQVREQVLMDMREGRKWKVDVMLSSQALVDFDPTMISFATGIFILNGGEQIIEEVSQTFGLSDPAEKDALRHQVHGPRAGGGTFLAKFDTKSGWYTMLLSASLGPIELWAFSTTTEDVIVRNKLYELLGPKKARRVLARKYPGGSCEKEIEERKKKLRESSAPVNILDEIVKELVAYAEKLPG